MREGVKMLEEKNGYRQLVFDPLKILDYTAFLIKRIA